MDRRQLCFIVYNIREDFVCLFNGRGAYDSMHIGSIHFNQNISLAGQNDDVDDNDT